MRTKERFPTWRVSGKYIGLDHNNFPLHDMERYYDCACCDEEVVLNRYEDEDRYYDTDTREYLCPMCFERYKENEAEN